MPVSRAAPLPWLRAAATAVLLLLLAACAGTSSGNYAGSTAPAPSVAPTQYYPPPGPPDDPWGPYITEAANRYNIPPQWIRAVMQQESGGQEQAVSPVGAIGLMQVMPATYDGLRDENGLGDDPFNPHDNILAGAAYIKQMYDRYGSPGFLAAYNAGPDEVDGYLAGDGPLPDETVNYLAAIAPNLGNALPFSGPMANYQVASGGVAPTPAGFASGCDVNAAYDPDHPCAAAPAPADQGGGTQLASAQAGACDADRAYDPDSPCTASGGAGAGSCNADTVYDPDNPCTVAAQPVAPAAAPAPIAAIAAPVAALDQPQQPPEQASAHAPAQGDWAIQVGAFSNPNLARAIVETARRQAPVLADATISLPTTTPFGGLVLYRAQLIHLSAAAAITACATLNNHQLPCLVLRG